MDARTCDECGKVGHPPYFGWLRVRQDADVELMGVRALTWDACGVECLLRLCVNELGDEATQVAWPAREEAIS